MRPRPSLALALLALLVVGTLPMTVAEAQGGAAGATVPSVPLAFHGDAALAGARANGTIAGNGTPADPYRLEGLSFVAADRAAIEVKGTRKHLVLANVSIQGSGASGQDGIRLVDAQNVTVEAADVQFVRTGILLQDARNVTVGNSTVRAGQTGIALDATIGARVLSNRLAVNGEDVSFRAGALRNVLRGNELSIATGHTALSFASPAVYDNDVDASNVVNFVPVRWYTHVHGNESEPRVLEGSMYVKGATNVGQVVCYDCRHVRLEGVNATLGAGAGIVVERGENVSVHRAFAQANDLAGIVVRNSTNVTILGATFQENGRTGAGSDGAGILARNVTRLEVEQVAAHANRYGVHATEGSIAVRGSSLHDNEADGLHVKGATSVNASGNVVRANGGHGIRIDGGRNVSVWDETLEENGGAGVQLTSVLSASVAGSRISANARGGVVLEGKGLVGAAVRNNTLSGNGDAGVLLSEGVVLQRVEDNDLSDHARHIRLARRAEQNLLERNAMTAGPGQVGIHFDEESAYNNQVGPSNTVGGTPVQWHVALVGRPDAPLVLSALRVESENVTNVAQIMVYRASYVTLDAPVVAGGLRGIYAFRSSSLTIEGARTNGSTTGVEVSGTQSALVRDVTAFGAEVAVRLTSAQNVTVTGVSAVDSLTAVQLDDASRSAVIDATNASGARKASVVDPSATQAKPRNLVVDAGLDKVVGVGRNVTFSDAVGVARFGSERIVRQTWSFGDGAEETNASNATFRPAHAYAQPGAFDARYELETADGLVLHDTVRVRVLAPPDPPTGLLGILTPDKDGVMLNWTLAEDAPNGTRYTIYRGASPENLTLLRETTKNATILDETFDASVTLYYAVSAADPIAGEGPLSEAFALVYKAPPPPPSRPVYLPDELPGEKKKADEASKDTPLPPWVVLLALGGVARASSSTREKHAHPSKVITADSRRSTDRADGRARTRRPR